MKKFKLFRNVKIQKKLFSTLLLIFSIPILSVGIFLVFYSYQTFTSHYTEQIHAENNRVKSVLFDLTTNLYNLSNGFILNSELNELLTQNYADQNAMRKALDTYKEINTVLKEQTSIHDIKIYTNNSSIKDYNHFSYCDETLRNTDWYTQIAGGQNLFWKTVTEKRRGYTYYYLTLYRQIPLPLAKDFAILVINVSSNYLNNRLDNRAIPSMVCVNNDSLFYDMYGYSPEHTMPLSVKDDEIYHTLDRRITLNDQKVMGSVSTLQPYRSDDHIYIFSYSTNAIPYISKVTIIGLFIVLLALFIPCSLLYFYTNYFSARVYMLRQAMYQVSHGSYNIIESFTGNDELSETFKDLQTTIKKIEEKEAMVYETRLREQELINHQQELENRQQQIEYKMLTSQINPHFLYNTLETIRMRAFNEDNYDVAEAAKLLGKFLRYSLENIGTTSTTLDKELHYIQLYLKIQKLRFRDRVNYKINISPQLDPCKCLILPFLLQPIVENSMLHGLEKVRGNGWIEIEIYARDNLLFFHISDNGEGMDPETLQKLRQDIYTKDNTRSKSIGLYNINQRLLLCYGSSYGLKIDSIQGCGTSVSMNIPLKTQE